MQHKCSNKKVLLIGGVPGSGKTTIAKELSKRINGLYINVSEYAISKKLVLEYDKERDTYVIDENALVNDLLNYICSSEHKYVIVDTHYGEIFPQSIAALYFILRIDPRVLYVRLKKRGWSERKIRENVLAEILGVITVNALSSFSKDKICEINVTSKGISEIMNEIYNTVIGRRKCRREFIDWTLILDLDSIEKFMV